MPHGLPGHGDTEGGLSDEELDSLVFCGMDGKPLPDSDLLRDTGDTQYTQEGGEFDEEEPESVHDLITQGLIDILSRQSNPTVIDIGNIDDWSEDIDASSYESVDGLPIPGMKLDLSKRVTMRLPAQDDDSKDTKDIKDTSDSDRYELVGSA